MPNIEHIEGIKPSRAVRAQRLRATFFVHNGKRSSRAARKGRWEDYGLGYGRIVAAKNTRRTPTIDELVSATYLQQEIEVEIQSESEGNLKSHLAYANAVTKMKAEAYAKAKGPRAHRHQSRASSYTGLRTHGGAYVHL